MFFWISPPGTLIWPDSLGWSKNLCATILWHKISNLPPNGCTNIHGFLRGWLSPKKRSTYFWDLCPSAQVTISWSVKPLGQKISRRCFASWEVGPSGHWGHLRENQPPQIKADRLRGLWNLANHQNYVVRPYFLGAVALRGVTLGFPWWMEYIYIYSAEVVGSHFLFEHVESNICPTKTKHSSRSGEFWKRKIPIFWGII